MLSEVRTVCGHIWRHPSNRGRRLRALARGVRWQMSKRLTGSAWDLPLPNGLRLRCHPDSAVAGLVLYASGVPDHDEMRFLADYLRPGDTFLDVGANIGSYVLFTAPLVGPEGSVIALEPGGAARARLVENLELNGLEQRVQVHPTAASESDGTACFSIDLDTQNGLVEGDVSSAVEEVPTARLDTLLAGERIAAAKLDLEGAEPMALRGATGLLAASNPPVLLLELNRVALRRFDEDETSLVRQIEAAGYVLTAYDADARRLEVLELPLAPHHSNLIAVANDSLGRLVQRIDGLTVVDSRPAQASA